MNRKICLECKHCTFYDISMQDFYCNYYRMYCYDIDLCDSYVSRNALTTSLSDHSYVWTINAKIGEKIRNDNYRTTLRSFDEKENSNSPLSTVEISCKDYETFTKVVEAVLPILEKEDKPRCK